MALAKLVVPLIVQAVLAQLENEDMPEQIASYTLDYERNILYHQETYGSNQPTIVL